MRIIFSARANMCQKHPHLTLYIGTSLALKEIRKLAITAATRSQPLFLISKLRKQNHFSAYFTRSISAPSPRSLSSICS